MIQSSSEIIRKLPLNGDLRSTETLEQKIRHLRQDNLISPSFFCLLSDLNLLSLKYHGSFTYVHAYAVLRKSISNQSFPN